MSTTLSEKLATAFKVTDEIGLEIEPTGLPDFDDTTLEPNQVSTILTEAVAPALYAHAELLGSAPVINAMRSTHIQRAQGMLERARLEAEEGFEKTLRAAPKATALMTAAGNEATASTQLGRAVTSMITDLSSAYTNMDTLLEVLDQSAPLLESEDALAPSWKLAARGAIALFLTAEK